ncbi:MAG: peptide chain release factor family protein [Verrucomicrobiota bacterium]
MRIKLDQMIIAKEEVKESFIRGSGRGGQKVNKTSGTVQLVHVPTGIVVKCQEGRSQEKNRRAAWAELERKLTALKRQEAFEKKQAAEKEKRRKRGRSFAGKQAMLQGKRHQSQKKAVRHKPSTDD